MLQERFFSYNSNGNDNYADSEIQLINKCKMCQGAGRFVESIQYRYYSVKHSGFEIRIDNVPAWYCNECGEFFFNDDDIKNIKEEVIQLDPNPDDWGCMAYYIYDHDQRCLKYPD